MGGSLKARALAKIGTDTVSARRSAGNTYSVFFLGLELGQIRPIEGKWGWRTRDRNHVFSTQEEAAIGFADWVLRRFWAQFKEKIERKFNASIS